MEKSASVVHNNGEDEINGNGNSASKTEKTEDDGWEIESSKRIQMHTKFANF